MMTAMATATASRGGKGERQIAITGIIPDIIAPYGDVKLRATYAPRLPPAAKPSRRVEVSRALAKTSAYALYHVYMYVGNIASVSALRDA